MNLPLKNFKAVLFDLDGVLIDSMPYHVSAWQQIFEEHGIKVSAEVFQLAEGEKATHTIRKLAAKHNLDWSDDALKDLIDRKRSIYRQNAPRGMRSEARRAVDFCRSNGLKTAIVTGSVQSNLQWTLSDEERAQFDFVLSSEFYQRGKPDPEPYLNAARALNVQPQECLVVENAPLGIRSAKAAEMICVAITTTLPEKELHEADFVISDVDQLETLLQL
jgi:beta-phosphoglucomutase